MYNATINIQNSEPRLEEIRLHLWQEWADKILQLVENDGILVACGSKSAVVLPLEMKDDLKVLLGQRVSILRTDSDYRFRIIDTLNQTNRQ